MPPSNESDAALTRQWLPYAIFFAFFLVHLAVFSHFGPQFIDDAYITFRYAERIAGGLGFTFNDGQAVLGTTTPLWTLLIASGIGLGLSATAATALLTSLSAAFMCLAIWSMLRHAGHGTLGLIGALALLVYERWLFNFLMGMETVLYMALVFWIFALCMRRRWSGIGWLGAMAILCRPDGAVVAALGLVAAGLNDQRAALRQAGWMILILLPWIAFAFLAFGSPIPHSVAAKQVIHPAGLAEALGGLWRQIGSDPFFLFSLALGGVGSVFVLLNARRTRLGHAWAAVAWPVLFVAGLGMSGIQVGLFPWYQAPLIAGIWLLALIGLAALGEALAKATRRGDALTRQAPGLVLLALMIIQTSGFWARNWREFPPPLTAKERYYMEAARGLAPLVEPGATVLVGEVGVMGYVLKNAVIIDSSGINSPAVYDLRRGSPAGAMDRAGRPPDWVARALEEMRPDWVVSLPQFLGMEAVVRNPALAPQYTIEAGGRGGLVVLKRK